MFCRSARTHGLQWLVTGLLVLAIASPATLQADDLDRSIDSARIKLRARKYDEALAILDALLDRHCADPRVHYYRAVVLVDADRPNDAADAIEQAERTFLDWIDSDRDDDPIEPIEHDLFAMAEDLLEYRKPAREQIERYVEAGAEAVAALIEADRHGAAAWILDEVARIAPGDERMTAVREGLDTGTAGEMRMAWRNRSLEPVTDRNALRTAEECVADAARANGRDRYDDGRLSALAALELVPTHVGAGIELARALEGMDREDEALRALLIAMEQPLGDDRTARSRARALHDEIAGLCQPLGEFVTVRADTANSLVFRATRAERDDREWDRDWLMERAVIICPALPEVVEQIGEEAAWEKLREFRGGGGGVVPSVSDADWVELGEDNEWELLSAGRASGWRNGVLYLFDSGDILTEAVLKDRDLPTSWTVQLALYYHPRPGQTPQIHVRTRPDTRTAAGVMMLPDPDSEAVVQTFDGNRWNEHATERMRNVLQEREWHDIEVAWDGSRERATLTVDGDVILDTTVSGVSMTGALSIGFSDGRTLSVKDLRVLPGVATNAGTAAPASGPDDGPDDGPESVDGWLTMRPGDWRWVNKGPGSGEQDGGVMHLTPARDSLSHIWWPRAMGDAFHVRFELNWTRQAGTPTIWLMFEVNQPDPDPSSPRALLLFPLGGAGDGPHVAYARRGPRSFVLSEIYEIPRGVMGPDRWTSMELRYDARTRHMVLTADGHRIFDYRLQAIDRMDGGFSIGVSEGADVDVRNMQIRDD